MIRNALFCLTFGLLVTGCGISEAELRQKTGDAAVSVKRAADGAGESLKGAYDDAAKQGRLAMKNAEAQLSDAALRAKVLAGFKLVTGLDSSAINVEVREQKLFLSGTVPSQLDKMKAEGVAYGVTGSQSKFESKITVKEKA